jgi:3-deoxy-manno-octulosonate cytidylyltransferase (CMP-KDO synthetase)
MTDDVLLVIPARYDSTRYPGKPLVQLVGGGVSRSLIEWTWRAAVAAVNEAQVIVATDDQRIVSAVENFGGRAVMTAASLRNGTERCAAVIAQMASPPSLIINLQGDAPLVPPHFINDLVRVALERNSAMASPYLPCDAVLAGRLREQARKGLVGGTCVVTDKADRALYFSKYPIPHGDGAALSMHVGLYAYTPDALARYLAAEPSAAELSEGLEQLRFLDMGVRIDMLAVDPPSHGLWELNNPEDVPLVEAGLGREI